MGELQPLNEVDMKQVVNFDELVDALRVTHPGGLPAFAFGQEFAGEVGEVLHQYMTGALQTAFPDMTTKVPVFGDDSASGRYESQYGQIAPWLGADEGFGILHCDQWYYSNELVVHNNTVHTGTVRSFEHGPGYEAAVRSAPEDEISKLFNSELYGQMRTDLYAGYVDPELLGNAHTANLYPGSIIVHRTAQPHQFNTDGEPELRRYDARPLTIQPAWLRFA